MSKFITSQRGQPLLTFRGFKYRKNGGGSNLSQPWRCTVEGCKGKASTPKPAEDGCRVITRGNHSHPSDPADQELAVLRDNVLKRAGEGAQPRRVLSEEAVGLSQEARGRLQAENLKRSFQRARERGAGLPPIPGEDEDLQVPERFQVTLGGRRFLLFDNRNDEDNVEDLPRIIMFASDNQLRILRSSRHIHYDGTFKVAPALFYQLFVIHAVRDSFTLPCVFCLVTNKTQETYSAIFNVIRQRLPNWEPETALGDFELTSHRAFSANFHRTRVTGCLFHLCQSVYRQATNKGLRDAYETDEVVRKHVKYLSALAFVPPQQVSQAFAQITESEEFPQNENLENLYDYFESTYIGREMRGRRREPRFPIHMWNQLERVEEGLARTNNLIEGWHRGIQSSLDGDHPSVWKCMQFLQVEEQWSRTADEVITGGGKPRKERREQKTRTTRLRTIVQDYPNRNILDFLRGITYNIHWELKFLFWEKKLLFYLWDDIAEIVKSTGDVA